MRNLQQWPLSEREIVECLGALASELAAEPRLGDIRPVILRTTVELVKAVGRAQRGVGAGQPIPSGADQLVAAIEWNDTAD